MATVTVGGDAKAAEKKASVRVTQQFRERHNMTYELDCSGARLIVRVFPLDDADPPREWRVEARVSDQCDAVVATATGLSRAAALEAVASWWRDNGPAQSLAPYDWNGVAKAMAAVRAI